MAFQRLNIRAKKSFPGLYSFDDSDNFHSAKSIVTQNETLSHRVSPEDNAEDCDFEEFGATLERCNDSQSKNSPSKRNKLFRSLRSLRSLRNLHSPPRRTKQIETTHTQYPVKDPDSRTTPTPMSPSLALNFEQSPPDQPIFELNLRHRSVSGSSLEVQHSSPMTVPGSVRQMDIYNLSPSSNDFPTGTIPTTPGPLQRAFERDPANHVHWQNASLTPLEGHVPSAPVLTPLPGTNLSLEDVDAALTTLPPSVTPLHTGQHTPGYFGLPSNDQLAMRDAEVSDGLTCLQLDAHHGDVDLGQGRNKASNDRRAYIRSADGDPKERLRHEYGEIEQQDNISTRNFPQYQNRALHRKQQDRDLYSSVQALDNSQHHQALPFRLRLKQQDKDVQDHVRTDSVISEDWITSSSERSTSVTSEQFPEHHSTHRPHGTKLPSNSPSCVPPEGRKETRDENDASVSFGYIGWGGADGTRHRASTENAWGRHSGLYDGTGYGDDTTLPATPREPDEGIRGIYEQSNYCSPTALSALPAVGERSGKKISTPHRESEDPGLEHT